MILHNLIKGHIVLCLVFISRMFFFSVTIIRLNFFVLEAASWLVSSDIMAIRMSKENNL
jgi:hypothetical protein